MEVVKGETNKSQLLNDCYHFLHYRPQIDADQAVEIENTIYQDAAEAKGDAVQADGEEAAEAEGDEQEANEAQAAAVAGMSDTDYCNLDFSQMKRPSLAREELQQTPETEYAEIKKEKAKAGRDGEDKEEEDEEPELSAPNEKEGDEAVALYSTVQDVMNEV